MTSSAVCSHAGEPRTRGWKCSTPESSTKCAEPPAAWAAATSSRQPGARPSWSPTTIPLGTPSGRLSRGTPPHSVRAPHAAGRPGPPCRRAGAAGGVPRWAVSRGGAGWGQRGVFSAERLQVAARDPLGAMAVDAHRQTSVPSIYAAGDVTGEAMFVYVAAAANALGLGDEILDVSALRKVTVTDPAAASVGLTDPQAEAAGVDCTCSTLPLAPVPRTCQPPCAWLYQAGGGARDGARGRGACAGARRGGNHPSGHRGGQIWHEPQRSHQPVLSLPHQGGRDQAGRGRRAQRCQQAFVLRGVKGVRAVSWRGPWARACRTSPWRRKSCQPEVSAIRQLSRLT